MGKLALACLVWMLTATAAAAEPTADELEARRLTLTAKLGRAYTVVVEPPFVVIGDDPPAVVKKYVADYLRKYIGLFEAEYFKARPAKLIEVWLFRNERTYRAGAKKFFGDTPDTPYGYYSSDHDAMIMNIGPGAGTLVHELVHPYVEANFPAAPSWFNEGLASLYERPTSRKGHVLGLTNWRLPSLQRAIRDKSLPPLTTMLASTRDGFYEASYDSYAYARYVMQYLQDQGKLTAFYEAFVADTKDPTGQAALEATLGEKLDTFEPKFRTWAAALKPDR